MKHLKWLVLCLFVVSLIGCGGKEAIKPDWVMKGSGAFPGDPVTVIYGVGVANAMPNEALQRKASDNRAREEVASSLKTSVASMVKDFMEHHVDYFNPDTAGSDEFVSYINKSVTDTTLINCKIVDRWVDTKTGSLYALARMDMNNNLYDSYKNAMKNALREQHRAIVKERAEEAEQSLDAEIDKQREREKDILGIQ